MSWRPRWRTRQPRPRKISCFPILVDMGTRQRSEMNRLHSLRHDPLPTTAADQA